MQKDAILAALPKLSKSDLEAIHAVASSLLNGHTVASRQPGTITHPNALTALSKALNLAVSANSLPPIMVSNFDAKMTEVAKWLDVHIPGWHADRTVEYALLVMLFGILIKDLQKNQIKPTIGAVINHIARIPKVIENSFPGYVNAGLGNLILPIKKG